MLRSGLDGGSDGGGGLIGGPGCVHYSRSVGRWKEHGGQPLLGLTNKATLGSLRRTWLVSIGSVLWLNISMSVE